LLELPAIPELWHLQIEQNGSRPDWDVSCRRNKLGITSETFADCVNDNKYGDFVKKVAESMAPNKVEGTPTVFINGTRWERTTSEFNLDEFKAAVEAAKQ